ncbi:MAG: hotdog fold thioesterase [Cyclobacteriaceae bacterium]|nr:hotdog fold thioesterase [Cyclobacteriaceae bacterium]
MSNRKNPFAEMLGIEVIEVTPGFARVAAKADPQHANRLGFTHGGFLYSLADVAFELASNSHDVDAVGITTSMQFHRPMKEGFKAEATAKEMHLGKSLATYQVEVTSEGKLVATFTGTVFRKS